MAVKRGMNRGVLVTTATGQKQHFSEDLKVTFCGHRVAGHVVFAGMDIRDLCQECAYSFSGRYGRLVMISTVDECLSLLRQSPVLASRKHHSPRNPSTRA